MKKLQPHRPAEVYSPAFKIFLKQPFFPARFYFVSKKSPTIIHSFNFNGMDISKRLRVKPDYTLETIGHEITVFHPVDPTTLYLNETGALIWNLCNNSRTVEDIINILVEAYPESKNQIPEDVIAIIAQFVDNGIAELVD